MKANGSIYEFGPFRLDAGERLLLRDGQLLPLTPKAFEVLLALVENRNHIVEKDELMSRVWPDTCVEEVNLANNISVLRKVLGDGAGGERYIQTVPRRGYRFVANVSESLATSVSAPAGSLGNVSVMERTSEALPYETEKPPEEALRWWAKLFKGRTAMAVVMLSAIAVSALYIWTGNGRNAPAESAPTPIKAIAVLPVRPVSAGSRDETLEMGTTEALITRLSGIRGLAVRPLSAVLKYADPQQDAVAAGREQKVDVVVAATSQRSDDKIRITVRLWGTRDGASMWTRSFDEKLKDLFTLQDAIAERCVDALALQLTGEEKKQLTKHYTENQDAWQLYIQGRIFWNKRNQEDMKKALKCFEAAIKADPKYALAYAGLADTYWFMPWKVTNEKQQAAAAKALELDSTLAEAHAAMAAFMWDIQGDACRAEREFNRSLDLNPNYATAHHWYANLLSTLGRFDDGLLHIKKAQELDPQSLIIHATVGLHLCRCGQIVEGIEQLQRTVDIDSNFITAHRFLAETYLRIGKYQEALDELRKSQVKNEEAPIFACVYAKLGHRPEALKIFRKLKATGELELDDEAAIYAALGDNDHAITCLETILKQDSDLHCPGKLLLRLRADSRLERVVKDPRFEEIARRYE